MSSTTKKLIKLVVFLTICLLVFFIGYQLAIYQTVNNDKLLPHFNIKNNSTNNNACNSNGNVVVGCGCISKPGYACPE
jgi:hypothetical protein